MKKLFKGCAIGCFGMVVGVFSVIFGMAALIGFLLSETDECVGAGSGIESGSALVVDISRGFTESSTYSQANAGTLFSEGLGAYCVKETVDALRLAADDERISVILLKGGNSGASAATNDTLASVISETAAKKTVIAFLTNPTQDDYALVCGATKIILDSASEFSCAGTATTRIYLKNALENAGIGVQVTKVGRYKSAVEPFVSETISEADLEQTGFLLNDRWDYFLEKASARTKLSRERLQEMAATEPVMTAARAAELGFVDAAETDGAVIEGMKSLTNSENEAGFCQISLLDYMELTGIAVEPNVDIFDLKIGGNIDFSKPVPAEEESDENAGEIALLTIEGEIVNGGNDPSAVSGEKYSELIRGLRNDNRVKAVIVRVNSPGGSVYAAEKIRAELEAVAKTRPVYVSFGDVAASGGYWISTPAKKIFANPHTITGSIGVFGLIPNFEGLAQKIGVNTLTVKTAPFADLDTVTRPKTPEEMQIIQSLTDKIYARFIELVADSRKLSRERVREIAEGRVWTGTQAKEIGLIDDFADLEEVIAIVKNETGLSKIETFPQNENQLQPLLEIFKGENLPQKEKPFVKISRTAAENALRSAFPQKIEKIYNGCENTLKSLDDPDNVYARLPWIEVK